MILSLISLFACVEDVSKDKVDAKVEEVQPEAAAKAVEPAAAPEEAGIAWPIDPAKSSIGALGAKVTATHPITFKTFSGQTKVNEGKLTSVSFEVEMADLESDAERLTQHLKTPDFFDVANHPKATFASTTVTEGSDVEGMTHTIVGNLTIRGETKKVTFPAKVTMTDGNLTAETEFALNRQDFKVSYPGKADDLVQDKVVLTVKLNSSQPEA